MPANREKANQNQQVHQVQEGQQDHQGAGEKDQPRRRQARGERRIAQLLEAAATVFTTTGYTAASTNAIAREAGVSPGTLYQFFPNKEAIAIELGDRLMHEMRETYGEALAPVDPTTPLEQAVGAAVDRFIAFNCEHPVFFALMHGPDIPGRITEEHDALHATLLSRIEDLLSSVLPDIRPADLSRTAHMCLGLYKAGLELVLAHEGTERDAYVLELKNALIRYLAPLVGDRLGPTH
ncbi:TetR/AcrR family transcriptional regulator [Streptomyces shaanxiensis]|uniref:TetR/AcrR family transcriptional regulator n=1 Tax=Streptomyces shaanxiensis TaxID=653357 RepID=A0ABP7VY23_9ACTN